MKYSKPLFSLHRVVELNRLKLSTQYYVCFLGSYQEAPKPNTFSQSQGGLSLAEEGLQQAAGGDSCKEEQPSSDTACMSHSMCSIYPHPQLPTCLALSHLFKGSNCDTNVVEVG